MSHVRSEMSRLGDDVETSGGVIFGGAISDLRFFLRLRDFVEAVPTCFSYLRKARKELVVYVGHVTFMRTEDRILDVIFPWQSSRVWSARVEPLDLAFTLIVLQSFGESMRREDAETGTRWCIRLRRT